MPVGDGITCGVVPYPYRMKSERKKATKMPVPQIDHLRCRRLNAFKSVHPPFRQAHVLPLKPRSKATKMPTNGRKASSPSHTRFLMAHTPCRRKAPQHHRATPSGIGTVLLGTVEPVDIAWVLSLERGEHLGCGTTRKPRLVFGRMTSLEYCAAARQFSPSLDLYLLTVWGHYSISPRTACRVA